jgi:L-lactate dehydrogenase complex protein LldG
MTARDDIFQAIKRASLAPSPLPPTYVPRPTENTLNRFTAMAERAAVELRILSSVSELPDAISDILRTRNLPARLHVPDGSTLDISAWHGEILATPPGPEDAALAHAPLGIAETGTLVYAANASQPASWHFRAGLEIAVLEARNIVGHMEDALATIQAMGLPPTLNFVTGPSRTADIEQTLELGAHGPKTLCLLLIKE